MCGYRKGFSTQQTLLSLIETWKKVLDRKGYGGPVLMDLSKAYDAMNYDLLLAKLHTLSLIKNIWKTVGREQKSIQALKVYTRFERPYNRVGTWPLTGY